MSEAPNSIHEVVIAGSGPAGLTAAIYAGRANLNPVLIEGEQMPGGQLTITTDVENYPGFPEGILGPALVEEMRKQALKFGTTALPRDIKSVDLSNRPFTINLSNGETIRTHTFIIATGASARLLGLDAEKEFMTRIGGVSACATCDGPLFRNKRLAVIGGGDTAMEEANYLTRFASDVTVIHRRDKLRASKIMQDRAFKNPKIKFVWNSIVTDILDPSKKKVTAVQLENVLDQTMSAYEIDGVFVAIGHDPNIGFLNGQVKTNPAGFIIVDHPSTRTSVPGVFACGDVMDPNYKQAVTAAGTGCSAAIDAEKFLEASRD